MALSAVQRLNFAFSSAAAATAAPPPRRRPRVVQCVPVVSIVLATHFTYSIAWVKTKLKEAANRTEPNRVPTEPRVIKLQYPT